MEESGNEVGRNLWWTVLAHITLISAGFFFANQSFKKDAPYFYDVPPEIKILHDLDENGIN